MNVLLTGATGFFGQILANKLKSTNKLNTLSRRPGNDFMLDITKPFFYLPEVDLVIHCAGKAHSKPRNKLDFCSFYEVNFEGTKNLLNALEPNLPRQFVFISSVAVYGKDEGKMIEETHHILGSTPFSKSKIIAEELVRSWGEKNGVKVLILRLPLIVGSNPPGNLGKMINGIKGGTYFSIGGGKAKKSMVLAEDVAKLIAKCPDVSGFYNLTDGYHPSFSELESMICQQLKRPKPFNMPLGLAKLLGKIGDFIPVFPINTKTINKITQDLTFSDLKARQELGWNPSRVLDKWKI